MYTSEAQIQRYRRLAILTTLGLALCSPGRILAADDCDSLVEKLQAGRERQAWTAQRFVETLGLSPGQARRLLPTLDQAAERYLKTYQAQAELLPELIETYSAFAEEDRLNQGFSDEVERRTGRMHRREIVLRDSHNARLIELEKEAQKVLSPEQRELAGTFDPRGRRPADFGRRSRRQARLAPEVQELQAIQAELHELRSGRHPQPGPLGRYLLHPAALPAVYQIAGRPLSSAARHAVEVYENGTPDYPIDLCLEHNARLRKLRQEINNWNLINGLHLTQDQIENIVDLYESAAPEPRPTDDPTDPPRPTGRLLVFVEQAVREVLNPGQLAVLADYKPCLIPPKNLRDPVRIGQANDHTPYERWLERARKLSGRELRRAADAVLEREAKHFGSMTERERNQRRSLLMRVARRAARLSDAEFELSRAELAQAIAPPDREKALRTAADELVQKLERPGRIAQMMLKPDFIAQLRLRGEQLAAGPQYAPADLAKGPKAENCERGCAINPKHPHAKRNQRTSDEP